MSSVTARMKIIRQPLCVEISVSGTRKYRERLNIHGISFFVFYFAVLKFVSNSTFLVFGQMNHAVWRFG